MTLSGLSGTSALTGITSMSGFIPQVDNVNPPTLSIAGGTVTVYGSGFLPGATAKVGVTNLTGAVVSADGTQITATVPALSVGTFAITVTNNYHGNTLSVTVPGLLTITL